jgi:DNA-binding response OmpR family regulator
MLPRVNRLEVLRRLCSVCVVPVLMLTAHRDSVDPIVGLQREVKRLDALITQLLTLSRTESLNQPHQWNRLT